MQWGDCQRCGFSRAAQLWNLQLVSLSSTLVNLQRCGSLQSMDVFEDDVGCKASMWSEAWWSCCHQRIPSFANIQSCYLHEAGHLYNEHVIGNNLITMWKLLRGVFWLFQSYFVRVKKLIIRSLFFSVFVNAVNGEEQIKNKKLT